MKKMSRTQKMMLGVVFVPTILFGGVVVTHADASSGGKNGEVPVVTGFLGDPSQWGLTNHSDVVAEASGSKNGEVPVVTGFLGDPSQWGLTNHSYVVAEASAGGSKNGDIPVVTG